MVCKECKNWEGISNLGEEPVYGYCNCPNLTYGDTEWRVEGFMGDTIPDNLLLYYDEQRMGAGIKTGKNFGCIHYDDKQSG